MMEIFKKKKLLDYVEYSPRTTSLLLEIHLDSQIKLK